MSENHSVIMFFDLCRLCLTNKGSIDIFDQTGLQNDITICTGIQITLSDNLPRKVCSSCWDIVKKAMELRLIATKNNYHLKSLFEDENENCEISICEDLVEKLVQLEANGSEQVNINITVESSILNDSNKQPTSHISVRKDLFKDPQPTPEADEPKKAKTRFKEKIKSYDENKKEQNNSDSSTECDTTQTETKAVKKEKKKLKSSQDDEELIFNCEECSKTFDTQKKLYLHRRHHNKSIVCPLIACRKKFATKGDLEKHVRIHTGVKPFECEICKKTFTQKVTLRGHIKLIHCKPEG